MMIVLGVAGRPDTAADFGIVHGATAALLYSFSANARNIVLSPGSSISTGSILTTRLLLLLPLGGLSLLLSMQLAEVGSVLALALVLRRCAEWIAEVHISDMEVRSQVRPAARQLLLQALLFPPVAVVLLTDHLLAFPLLFAWASSPAWMCIGFIAGQTRMRELAARGWLQLLPHFGSTAVIGISVYVFRLLVLLLVGKTVAGDLYTAFAMGGLLGAVYGHAIGPTLTLHEIRKDSARPPLWALLTLGLVTISGCGLWLLAQSAPHALAFTGKTAFFWSAVGLSLIGSIVMILAWRLRLRILQHQEDNDVFGPDVLINVLVVAAVPYVFYLVGVEAMAGLYLLSAALSLVFYYSARKSADLRISSNPTFTSIARRVIAFLLLLPLFFQLSGSIFRETIYLFDTAGSLMRLPIPVSVIACFGGIVLLGGYSRANLSLTVLFATFALMLISSTMLAYDEGGQEQAKLILMIQFVLPMFALVLGQLYAEDPAEQPILAAIFFWLLAAIVPLQLVATWLQGRIVLTPYVYLFSLYQHLQYVPVIFTAVYLLALSALWEQPRYRRPLFALGAVMGVYVAASMSMLAIGLLGAGIAGIAGYMVWRGVRTRQLLLLALVAPALCAVYFFGASGNTDFFAKYRLSDDTDIAMPFNVVERLEYWKFYSDSILSDARTTALGHSVPPDRSKYRSAHNYYLDFAYNFGIIALLPLLALIVATFRGLWRKRTSLFSSPFLLGLASIVLFLVLPDNLLKVGMRQPYPGILTFFLWGLLLGSLFPPESMERRTNTKESPA